MTLLVIGDPHFKVDNSLETEAMSQEIIALAQQTKPDLIVCLGDVLDRHSSIHVSPLNRAINFLKQLETIAPLVVLVGNHDRPNNRDYLSDQHPFTACHQWPNTLIVDKVKSYQLSKHRLICVPYVPVGRFEEALRDSGLPYQEADLILAHQEFRGAKLGAKISDQGDVWPVNYPVVISGHIHDYQLVQANLLYVGTPIQHGFADQANKAVYSFSLPAEPIKAISDLRGQAHPLLTVPQKITLRLEVTDLDTMTVQQQLMELQNRTDVKVRLVIRGSQGQLKALTKDQRLKVWRKTGFKLALKEVLMTEEALPETGEVKDYLVHLEAKLANKPHLIKLWQELFP